MDYNTLEKLFDVSPLPAAISEALSNVSTAATTPTGSRCRLFQDHMVSAEVAFPCNEQPPSCILHCFDCILANADYIVWDESVIFTFLMAIHC